MGVKVHQRNAGNSFAHRAQDWVSHGVIAAKAHRAFFLFNYLCDGRFDPCKGIGRRHVPQIASIFHQSFAASVDAGFCPFIPRIRMEGFANQRRCSRSPAKKRGVVIQWNSQNHRRAPTSQTSGGSLHGRVIRKLPSTSASICVRTKQSSASSGRQTMGSLSLKEVFSTTGTPVWRSNSEISAW
jgi:hypothetical protein